MEGTVARFLRDAIREGAPAFLIVGCVEYGCPGNGVFRKPRAEKQSVLANRAAAVCNTPADNGLLHTPYIVVRTVAWDRSRNDCPSCSGGYGRQTVVSVAGPYVGERSYNCSFSHSS